MTRDSVAWCLPGCRVEAVVQPVPRVLNDIKIRSITVAEELDLFCALGYVFNDELPVPRVRPARISALAGQRPGIRLRGPAGAGP